VTSFEPVAALAGIVLDDVDSDVLAGASVVLDTPLAGDRLGLPAGALEGTGVAAEIAGGRIELSGLASLETYRELLHQVMLLSESPVAGKRELSVRVRDGEGAESHADSVEVAVAARLIGSARSDTLKGDASDDVIVGGAGSDILVGNGGDDVFGYVAAADGGFVSGNRTAAEAGVTGDTIMDFAAGDRFAFLDSGFDAAELLPLGRLDASAFAVTTAAYDNTPASLDSPSAAWLAGRDSFVFDGTGTLYYDANGAGEGYSVIATLAGLQVAPDASAIVMVAALA
jgi:Ca2+-binding RTX toxin-like protein